MINRRTEIHRAVKRQPNRDLRFAGTNVNRFSPEKLAALIIRKSSRKAPADSVLRDELKAQRGLSREDGAKASRAVFAYYRWFGWLSPQQPLEQQINSALNLAKRFDEAPASFPDAELIRNAVPSWIHDEFDVTPAWARFLQAEPRLWLRARLGHGAALATSLGHCRTFGSGPLSDVLEYSGSQDLFRTKEYQAGEFELQDINSQTVGLICAPQPRQTWWDACAGEGGKTLHLSDLMHNKGLIWASDRAAWRLQILRRRAARAKVFNFRTAPWTGGPTLPTKTKFDGILVDAPCSGIGTWHRNPHARWTTTRKDVQELSRLQKELLANVAPALKPGGKLIYAVCTMARAETVEVAQDFEKRFPNFHRLSISNPLNQQSLEDGKLWLWPQDSGGNGMFIAGWRAPAKSAAPV